MKLDDNTPPEEIDPLVNKNNLTILERYIFVSHWCKNKAVLDGACAYGKGTALLKALGAKGVTGIDIDKKALEYCKRNHANCEFEKVDLTKRIGNGHAVYDRVVSIETMEHLPKDDVLVYLRNLKRMLKREGKLVITTPIRKSKKFEYDGGTHLYEYDEQEFMSALRKVFVNIELFSIIEFKLFKEGMLHSELVREVGKLSKLFFAVCTKK